ncbi:MAG: TolC family protein, partial [Pirellulaceae bacterium]
MVLRNFNRSMLALAVAAWCALPVWGQISPTAEPGKNFLKPPPMPEAPYSLQQLDATGPLFPGQRYDGSDFLEAPAPVVSAEQAIGAETFGGDYSLPGMLQLASANNPTLRQAQLQISAQTAKALQAGLYPNPILNYIGEQIGVNGTAGEFQGMSVQQRFVTAQKLQLSREKYMRRAHVSEHQAMVQQFRVCNDVRIHFYRTLASWQIAVMRSELLKTAEDMAVTARELYNQGQANRPDVHRSNV